MIDLKPLPPKEAVDFFRQKGYRLSFDWHDMLAAEHQTAFAVAKVMQVDLLNDIRQAVDEAIANGVPANQFYKNLAPILQNKGWWGKQIQTNPNTGEIKSVQLGSPRRLKTIYDTNLRTAHAEGQWQGIQAGKKLFPYLMYDGNNSEHPRIVHSAWDGLVLRVDDPWWESHTPVKAYGCKCRVIQLSDGMLNQMGLKVGTAPPEVMRKMRHPATGDEIEVPQGVDPAFNYPLGQRRESLAKLLADRVQTAWAKVGAQVFAGARTVLPALTREYVQWLDAIAAGGRKGLGMRRVVGAMTADVVAGLATQGIEVSTAALSLDDRQARHLLATDRKGAKAVSPVWLYDLPYKLFEPEHIYFDEHEKNLLYVFLSGDRLVRLVVQPNFQLKFGKTNALKSAQRVSEGDLRGTRFIKLK